MPDDEISPEKIRSRPLASRRSFVRSASSEEISPTLTAEDTNSGVVDAVRDVAATSISLPDDTVLHADSTGALDVDAELDKVLAPQTPSSAQSVSTSTNKRKPDVCVEDSVPVSPKPNTFIPSSVREVEEKIAQSTAQHDESLRIGGIRQRNKPGKSQAVAESSEEAAKVAALVVAAVPVQGVNVLRLIRVCLIVLLGCGAGTS